MISSTRQMKRKIFKPHRPLQNRLDIFCIVFVFFVACRLLGAYMLGGCGSTSFSSSPEEQHASHTQTHSALIFSFCQACSFDYSAVNILSGRQHIQHNNKTLASKQAALFNFKHSLCVCESGGAGVHCPTACYRCQGLYSALGRGICVIAISDVNEV